MVIPQLLGLSGPPRIGNQEMAVEKAQLQWGILLLKTFGCAWWTLSSISAEAGAEVDLLRKDVWDPPV